MFASENNANQILYEFTFTSVTSAVAGRAPDTDAAMDVTNARSIIVQFDTTGSTSVNQDLNVLSTLNGTDYDTIPWASTTGIGIAQLITFPVDPGPAKIKLTLDNNGAATSHASAVVMLRG
jgi:hypothetical protein